MHIELTAVFKAADEGGYIAFVAELPGANTQAWRHPVSPASRKQHLPANLSSRPRRILNAEVGERSIDRALQCDSLDA